MKYNRLLILIVMFGLIFSLSGCVSNKTKIESIQKEDVSANKEKSSTYGSTGRNYADPDTNNQIDVPAKVVATPQTKIRSLPTGTILKRTRLIDGNGELTIKNGLDYDAVAVMTKSNDFNEAVLSVYIGAGNTYTISNIQSGEYYLFYKTGKDWDDSIGRFTMPEESSRFEDQLVYGSSPTGYSATLYPVTGGNAQTDSVSEADFPK